MPKICTCNTIVFGFIECFTTTFLDTYQFFWVDEDEVGLQEKPEDIRYIK